MSITQIRGDTQIKNLTIKDGQIALNAGIKTSKLEDGLEFLQRNGSVALTNDFDCANYHLNNVADPVNNKDAVNKEYVHTNFIFNQFDLNRNETLFADGNRTDFPLTYIPILNSEQVFLNGGLLLNGVNDDYTITSSTLTFNIPPNVQDRIRVDYYKTNSNKISHQIDIFLNPEYGGIGWGIIEYTFVVQ